jgi:hypothetical protein
MPSLAKLLSSYDLDLLTRIARKWEVDVESEDRKSIEHELIQRMTEKPGVDEMIPAPTKDAWTLLLSHGYRLPWSEFSLKFGLLRELGPAARDRESPDQNPQNASELLFYRGLIGRAFLAASPEPREFAFIPDEIADLYTSPQSQSARMEVRPVSSAEIKRHQAGNTRILDHVTDFLASLRMGQKLEPFYYSKAEISPQFITSITSTTGIVSPNGDVIPEKVGPFLQTDRLSLSKDWFETWRASGGINDLLMVPGLEFEGTWRNDPVFSRQVILDQLTSFDVQTWYSLPSFKFKLRSEMEDFLRPAGDFDSWSIRKAGSKEYLTGREHWEEVEGAYITYLISGPLHWLGVVDLAYGSENDSPIGFRLSPLANFLLNMESPSPVLAAESAPKLISDLTILMPVNSSRLLRYQVGRFTRIISNSISETRFQVSAESLTLAEKYGLKVEQLLQLLEKSTKTPLPSSFKKLAERWDQRRVEVKMEKATLLRVEDPQVISILKENPRTARLIRETLTENIILIDPAGTDLVKKVLLEAGILSQIELDV